MVTVKDTGISDFNLTKEVQELDGCQEAVIYQKAEAMTVLPEGLQSDELAAIGGLGKIAGTEETEGRFQVSAPIIILDDVSFLNYCSQIGNIRIFSNGNADLADLNNLEKEVVSLAGGEYQLESEKRVQVSTQSQMPQYKIFASFPAVLSQSTYILQTSVFSDEGILMIL